MHQVLLSVGALRVHTYGVAIAFGFFVGIVLASHQAARVGLDRTRILDLCFWILVFGLVGSRLLYVVTAADEYYAMCRDGLASGRVGEILARCTASLHFWEGGLVFYGGMLAALVATFSYAARHHMRLLRTADVLSPSLAIGHFFGRLGCLAAGCCFGKPTVGGAGARFPPGSLAYEDWLGRDALALAGGRTPPLHPTQLYEAGGELAIFFALLAVRHRQRGDGQVFAAYLTLYSLMRMMVEVFRGDAARKFVVELETPRLNGWLGFPPRLPTLISTSQAISITVAAGALALWVWLGRRQRLAPAATSG
jgi:phosphatidylglycerol:prolipoprotein diacylglycerol transferase